MKSCIQYLFLILSACILNAAYFFPKYCFVGVFIFLIPIYFISLCNSYPLNFSKGIFWGMCFWIVHLFWMVHLFGVAAYTLPLIVGFVVPINYILTAGLWFWLAKVLIRLVKKNTPLWIGASWIIATFGYFYWVRYCSFLPLGLFMGNPFGSPLLPLAQAPILLATLPILGEHILSMLLFISQWFIAETLYRKKISYLGLAICCLFPFVVGSLQGPLNIEIPPYVDSLGFVKPPLVKDPIKLAQAIDNQISHLIRNHPRVNTVLMPETSYPGAINESPYIIQLLAREVFKSNLNLIIGAQRSDEKKKKYNTIYWIKNDKTITYYDKNVRMPFTEYMPFPWNKIINFDIKDEVTDNEITRPLLKVNSNFTCIPSICSEIYFSSSSHPEVDKKIPLLVTVKEVWTPEYYLHYLMFLFAIFKAIQIQRDIIYVGYVHAYWISKTPTNIIPLKH